ncbi:acylphosphatase [Methanothrix sp.]|uniref:acylphosphatase n=2 Tax=Methanothrix TaxID=2222 RepID=UPI0032AF0D52
MRFTAYVSGKVQEVGYRARVVDIANALGLKGMIENLKDGRVKIIAEGEDEKKLKWFEDAIDIKNALIYVSSIEKSYSPASGEFNSFGKLVAKGETDTRLDTAAGYLKELISAVNKMNENLGGKMDQMLNKQDQMLSKQDQMLSKQDELLDEVISMNENLSGKIDQMNENLSGKMDQMLSKQDDLIIEVKNVNRKMDRALETGIVELKSDMAEVKSALKAKGII